MLNLVVCIIASDSDDYLKFKELWLKNISFIKSRKNNTINYHFYFLYGGDTTKINHFSEYTELYFDIPETLQNILRKTLCAFDYFNTKYDNNSLFLRTNLSTVFDFEKYSTWLSDIPLSKFFGGSIIDGYNGFHTKISGTNMIMSLDILQFVLLHQDRFSFTKNEDIELSSLIMYNYPCFMKTMKRLDFITTKVLYHRCNLYSPDISCFRFKSSDRLRDTDLASHILNLIHSNQSIITYIRDLILPIVSEGEILEPLSTVVWRIDPLTNDVIYKSENVSI
jgi:hypothetical protein